MFYFNSFLRRVGLSISACCIASTAYAATPETPSLTSLSYVLMDVDSGTVMIKKNEHKAYPPASLTKMMTAYLISADLSSGRIQESDQVPVSVNAWKKPGSRMFIREGTEVSVGDLLRGIIIQSGNDAAVAMAEYLSGDEISFSDRMNREAQRLGMKNTRFFNATGLPHKGHVSSAYDLGLLGSAIVKDYPEYYPLYSQRQFEYNDIVQYNRNRLLLDDNRVQGLKTGWTKDAKYCMATSAEVNDLRLVAVVMGAENPKVRMNETRKLLDYGYRYYERVNLAEKGQTLARMKVWYGKTDQVEVGVDESLSYLLPKRGLYPDTPELQVDKPDTIQVKVPVSMGGNEFVYRLTPNDNLTAPIQLGDKVGTVKVFLNGEPHAEYPMTAMTAVEKSGFFKGLWQRICRFVDYLFG